MYIGIAKIKKEIVRLTTSARGEIRFDDESEDEEQAAKRFAGVQLIDGLELKVEKLEDALDETDEKMADLSNSHMKAVQWRSATVDEKVVRLDRPSKDKKTDNEEDDASPQVVAKLFDPLVARQSDTGRRFEDTESTRSKASLRSNVNEGKELARHQWAAVTKCGQNIDDSCILPILAVTILTRKHPMFPDSFNIAYVTPYCVNGSLESAITRICGRPDAFQFTEDLLKSNLARMLRSLYILERQNIYHGNITESNIFVSNDGNSLMLGDFVPKSEFREWISLMSNRQASLPSIPAPELISGREKRNINADKIDVHKIDIYCLGVVFLHAATLEKPDPTSPNDLRRLVKKVHDNRASDLATLIGSMVEGDVQKRPSLKQLYNTSSKWLPGGWMWIW
eukprot:GHVO01010649.1.p1 GENE.GHVO01010649.1~~GHVO01010649.1.p1  ORF type:complete len:396 (+),score=59.38 GHVO01010649.1:89-1276(+)